MDLLSISVFFFKRRVDTSGIHSICSLHARARLTQVDVEGAPLLGAGVEVATFHV